MVAPTSGPADTCPSPFASPGMLLLSDFALSAWLPLAAPLYLLKALLYCALAAPEVYLSLTQYARRTVRPGEGYALVTGASSGIGADIACELSRAGFDLILVAQRADRLEALVDELRGLSKRKLDVRTLPRDLTADRASLEPLRRARVHTGRHPREQRGPRRHRPVLRAGV